MDTSQNWNRNVVKLALYVEMRNRSDGRREPLIRAYPITEGKLQVSVMLTRDIWKVPVHLDILSSTEFQDQDISVIRYKVDQFVDALIADDPNLRSAIIDEQKLVLRIPDEVVNPLRKFHEDYGRTKTAFLMMQFADTAVHREIESEIKRSLRQFNILGLRADEKYYHDNLHYNVLTYMYGCDIGIAIFDNVLKETFNPNVALEVGYMLSLRKPICLLKDRSIQTLQADLVGKLYEPFDSYNITGTIGPAISKWLSANTDFQFPDSVDTSSHVHNIFVRILDLGDPTQSIPAKKMRLSEPPLFSTAHAKFYLLSSELVCQVAVHMFCDVTPQESDLFSLVEDISIYVKTLINKDDTLRYVVTGGRYIQI
ncbi:MAG: hypothetical protein IPK17_32660 [Chloroflexi bacterium]|uniref:hypothetical protein n=1 Tax=Candidatus Flexifilum breve TaxID=3140694 RepID=UPI0031363272|nr:hypothetical protein [Chloroflexota bacterium]